MVGCARLKEDEGRVETELEFLKEMEGEARWTKGRRRNRQEIVLASFRNKWRPADESAAGEGFGRFAPRHGATSKQKRARARKRNWQWNWPSEYICDGAACPVLCWVCDGLGRRSDKERARKGEQRQDMQVVASQPDAGVYSSVHVTTLSVRQDVRCLSGQSHQPTTESAYGGSRSTSRHSKNSMMAGQACVDGTEPAVSAACMETSDSA
jgi:hypothetical protein